jgi:hypothetical protein
MLELKSPLAPALTASTALFVAAVESVALKSCFACS